MAIWRVNSKAISFLVSNSDSKIKVLQRSWDLDTAWGFGDALHPRRRRAARRDAPALAHAPADRAACTLTLTLTDSTEQRQQQSAVGAEALLDTLLLAGLARRALARV